MNQNLFFMIDRDKHQQLRIGLASPEQICAWSKRILPNGRIVGQVTKPYTLHYKTNEPEKDGSFCERIFGPIKSGVCACGNSRVIGNEKENSKFCEQCGVEFVDSRIRRYRMGYIELACPVVHVWYSKRLPSYIANLLAKPLKESEGPVYCDVRLDHKFRFCRSGIRNCHPIQSHWDAFSSDMSLRRNSMKLRITSI